MTGSQTQDTPTPGPAIAQADHHLAMQQRQHWPVPAHYNIAQRCCERWADAKDSSKRIAIIDHGTGTQATFHTYFELQQAASRLSCLLRSRGVLHGDRVAIVLPQGFEAAVAYMAVLQMGAVAVPLSLLFGPDALLYRLHDSEAVVAVCDARALDAVQDLRGDCPQLREVVGVRDTQGRADLAWDEALAAQPAQFHPVRTAADEAAVLIYTSGTTGNPKGALMPHRALIGNLTGFVCSQNGFGQDVEAALILQDDLPLVRDDTVFWSPADWAWTGGLMDALLPTLYFGRPIVAYAGRFGAEQAFTLMQTHRVTHTFLFPTALKAMMKACPEPRRHYTLHLQAIMSAGEAVGDAVFAYCQQQLGVIVNEMFGQTEINYIVGNCALNGQPHARVGWPARPGSMGKGYPGHRVAVIDEAGQECPVGVSGDVALHRLNVHGEADPIFFLGYWKSPAATHAKFTGDWCRTGDLATRDADGYLWYQGRSDDVFKSAGYRIGPSEIENCLVKHPAVANAAVVPKPDAERGALVKAYIVLAPEFIAKKNQWTGTKIDFDSKLIAELQDHVRQQLAPYEYPKDIEFIDQLPMTTTGKVQRRVLRLQEEARARSRENTTE